MLGDGVGAEELGHAATGDALERGAEETERLVVRVGEDPVDHLTRAVANDRVDEDVLAELVEQPAVPRAVVGETGRGIGGGVAQREEPAGAALECDPRHARLPPDLATAHEPRSSRQLAPLARAERLREGAGERAVPGEELRDVAPEHLLGEVAGDAEPLRVGAEHLAARAHEAKADPRLLEEHVDQPVGCSVPVVPHVGTPPLLACG